MSNDKYTGVADYFRKATYDSDEDLPEDTRNKIRQKELNMEAVQPMRDKAWEAQGPYPKLKRLVKGMAFGDMKAKKDK